MVGNAHPTTGGRSGEPAQFRRRACAARDLQLLTRVPTALKIGSVVVDPPILQAPMAGFTNYAYRQIVRQFGGAGLQATEMISAKGFVSQGTRRQELPDRLWGVKDEPRPLAVQIWDNDPGILAEVGAV